MKQLFTVIFILFAFNALQAQKYALGFSTGYSTFLMKSLKSNNQNIVSNLPFESKIIDDFPSNISFGGYFLRKIATGYYLGFAYDYTSTGSRISASDYSGKYFINEILKCQSLGMINSFRIITLGHWQAEARINMGFNMSKINISENLQFADTTISNSSYLESNAFYLKPGVVLGYVHPSWKVGADFDYMWDTKGIIMTHYGKESLNKTDWSGLRLGIILAIFPEEIFRK